MAIEMIEARWPAPPNVHAITTTREGGVSAGPFRSLNLGGHVGDERSAVERNRALVAGQLNLPGEPAWLTQVHGDDIVLADTCAPGERADGSFTTSTGTVCAVMTADCVPLFLCSAAGTRAGVFHIGWKGLAGGLVRKAARIFTGDGQAVAWLGPAIGPGVFEIGVEVKSAIQSNISARGACFRPSGKGKWLADLYSMIAGELGHEGVDCHYDDTLCTFSDPSRFFSYRRGNPCGRMASLIWMK